jgi:hypothetical protein
MRQTKKFKTRFVVIAMTVIVVLGVPIVILSDRVDPTLEPHAASCDGTKGVATMQEATKNYINAINNKDFDSICKYTIKTALSQTDLDKIYTQDNALLKQYNIDVNTALIEPFDKNTFGVDYYFRVKISNPKIKKKKLYLDFWAVDKKMNLRAVPGFFTNDS